MLPSAQCELAQTSKRSSRQTARRHSIANRRQLIYEIDLSTKNIGSTSFELHSTGDESMQVHKNTGQANVRHSDFSDDKV